MSRSVWKPEYRANHNAYMRLRTLLKAAGLWHKQTEWASTSGAFVSPTTRDLEWAAGFLEGEGSFGFGHSMMSDKRRGQIRAALEGGR